METSKQAIRDIQRDLVRVEAELRYVQKENSKLEIIKVEAAKRHVP